MVVHGRLYLGTSSAFCFLIPERFISDTLPNGNVTGTWEGLVKIRKVPEVVPCVFLSIYCQASAWTSPPGAPVLLPNSSVGETMCSCDCVFLPGWVQQANRKKLKEHLSHYASFYLGHVNEKHLVTEVCIGTGAKYSIWNGEGDRPLPAWRTVVVGGLHKVIWSSRVTGTALGSDSHGLRPNGPAESFQVAPPSPQQRRPLWSFWALPGISGSPN